MLHQLEFKLHVEKQYQRAIDNMVTLYKADGDKKSRQDAEAKQVESNRKIQLLQQAVKRYKNLHIYDDPAENEEDGLSRHLASFFLALTPWQSLELMVNAKRGCASLYRANFESPSRPRESSTTYHFPLSDRPKLWLAKPLSW
jgi:hypothetical protein